MNPTNSSALTVQTPHGDYLAANPKAARTWAAGMAEFKRKFNHFIFGDGECDGVKVVLQNMVHKTDEARQVGITLVELADMLPGRELTMDFYEQHKAEFTDAHGQPVAFQILQWFIRTARKNPEPIDNFLVASNNFQPLLLTAGVVEPVKVKSGDRTGKPAEMSNPYLKITNWLDGAADVREQINEFEKHPHFGSFDTLNDRRADLHWELKQKFQAAKAVIDWGLTKLGNKN